MPTRIRTTTKVITSAPLLPVALATGQYQAAALVIIAAALEVIADQEQADVTPAQA